MKYAEIPEPFRQLKAYTPVEGKQAYLKDWPHNPLTLNQIEAEHPDTTGVGLIHTYAHTVALDIDDLEWCREKLPQEGLNLDDLLDPTKHCIFISPKANSAKVIFAAPEGAELVSGKVATPDEDGTVKCRFEVRCSTLYDVMPGSTYPDGGEYGHEGRDMPQPMPQVLLDLIQQWRQARQAAHKSIDGKSKLTRINGDQLSVAWVFNRTHSLTEVLRDTGRTQEGRKWLSPNSDSKVPGIVVFPSTNQPWDLCLSYHASDGDLAGKAVDAFEIAARDTYPNLPSGDAKSQFAKDQAKKLKAIDGNGNVMKETVAEWNAENAREELPPIRLRETVGPPQPEIDLGLLLTDDLMGQMTQAIMDATATRSNPIAAFFTGLAVTASIMGGRYAYEVSNLRPNLYIALLGNSSCGKSSTTAVLHQIRTLIGEQHIFRYEEDVASAGGIENSLEECQHMPDMLIRLDELGDHFHKLKERNRSHGSAELLMRLYSASNTTYITRSLASKKQETIYCPCVSVIGTSTEANMEGVLDPKDLTKGLPARYLFAGCNQDSTRKSKKPTPLNHGMPFIQALQKIQEQNWENSQNVMDRLISPYLVGITDEAYAVWDEHDATIHEHKRSDADMRTKWMENALKIAMIKATLLNPEQPMIDKDIMVWASAVADYCVLTAAWFAGHTLSASDEEMARVKYIQYVNERGGDVLLRQARDGVAAFKRLDRYGQKMVLESLVEHGEVAVYEKRLPSGQKEKRVRLV